MLGSNGLSEPSGSPIGEDVFSRLWASPPKGDEEVGDFEGELTGEEEPYPCEEEGSPKGEEVLEEGRVSPRAELAEEGCFVSEREGEVCIDSLECGILW